MFLFSLFWFPCWPAQSLPGNPRREEGKTATAIVERMCGRGVTSTGARAGRRDECRRRGGSTRAGGALRLRGTVRCHRSQVQPHAAALPSPNVCAVFCETAVSKHLGVRPLSRPRHRGNRNLGHLSRLRGCETQCPEDIPHREARRTTGANPSGIKVKTCPLSAEWPVSFFCFFLFFCFPDLLLTWSPKIVGFEYSQSDRNVARREVEAGRPWPVSVRPASQEVVGKT